MAHKGNWALRSPTDPRWNCAGEGYVGGFKLPLAAEQELEERKEALGEEPPEDLEYIYSKDEQSEPVPVDTQGGACGLFADLPPTQGH